MGRHQRQKAQIIVYLHDYVVQLPALLETTWRTTDGSRSDNVSQWFFLAF